MAKNIAATSAFDVTGIIPEKRVKSTEVVKKKNTTDGIKRAYYLTPEQDKAIALKAATEGMKKNEVVQEALNLYLKDYLE
jgi:hypothetical protein